MEIITAHNITDLDGLAAMVAASKLYENAQPVFVDRLHRLVRNFMALYREELNILSLDKINPEEITRLIIVDTYDLERLGTLKNKIESRLDEIEIIVYDHHPHDPEDIPEVDLDLSQEVGSATTILVNKIRAENYQLNPIEATICALGIYADTGNFTHLDITPDDLSAASYLLDIGANMKIINEFRIDELNSSQQEVYNSLLSNREDFTFEGIEVTLFSVKHDQYVAGLNNVIEKLKSFLNLTVIFILVEMEENTLVISRSSDEAVNAGRICEYLGGGGHSGAASARLKMTLEPAKSKLKSVLESEIKPSSRVKDIMTRNVKTISPDIKISEAEKIMVRYGHNGLIVCDEGEIKGVFSRSDIDKVREHDLMHAPVRGYMSKNVIKINSKAPVSRARELMVKYNIGRLPVIEDDSLLGIITRSDIINSYYQTTEIPYRYQNIYGNSLVEIEPQWKDITNQLAEISGETISILKKVGEIGQKQDNRIYLVGGMVRDLLLGRNNWDLDFVIEGKVKQMAEKIAKFFGAEYTYNEDFATANIQLSEFNLDLACARKEFYPSPGVLPETQQTDILEDLFRRDYTVNALALNILPKNWGQLLDFFRGQQDLKKKKLRILHRFSFLDDPTRIIRGLRQAIELDFSFEQETSSLAREALTAGDFSGLSLSRVFREMKALFENRFTEKMISLLNKYPICRLLDREVILNQKHRQKLYYLEKLFAKLKDREYNIEKWPLRLYALAGSMSRQMIEEVNLTTPHTEILCGELPELAELKEKETLLDCLDILDHLSKEKIILAWLMTDNQSLKQKLEEYLLEVKNMEMEVDGYTLRDLGLKPGPEMKKILSQIRRAKIRGEVKNSDEEIEMARKLIEAKNKADK